MYRSTSPIVDIVPNKIIKINIDPYNRKSNKLNNFLVTKIIFLKEENSQANTKVNYFSERYF